MAFVHKIAAGGVCMAMALLAGCVADGGGATGATPALSATTMSSPPSGTGVDAVPGEEGSAGDSAEDSGGETVSSPQPPIAAVAASVPPPRAGSAVYRCSGGRSLTIDNRRTSLTLLDPDGETMILPAAPSGQTSRYGQKPYAIVLDGNEALYVKPRKSPFTCKRG